MLRSNKLLTFNLMPCLLNVESFLISSDLIASQLLLEIAHCIPLSPQSLLSHLISSHLLSSHFFHCISPHPISRLLSHSEIFSADHGCSLLLSCHLSFSHLFSSQLLNSAQLSAAHVSSSYVFSSPLPSSHIFQSLLTRLGCSQLFSSRHTSSQLFSGHSQIISALL